MPALHQWDYLFAIGTIFAGLDGFMIGANDVANSFATSVSSKSLTLKQACLAAAVMEFSGAVLVGGRVTNTIKDGIIPANAFEGNAGVQLLAFTCASVASSVWLTIATRLSWPVSTTYSVVAAITGVGIASAGWDAPKWGWNGAKGLGAIFSGLLIAPALSGCIAVFIYLLIKYGVLLRKEPTRWGLLTAPLVFFFVGGILTMAIIFKGSPSLGLKDMPGGEMAAAILGTASVVALLSVLFWLPYVHCTIVKRDYTLKWYHFFQGPLLWKRVPPADAAEHDAIPNYQVREANELDGEKKTGIKQEQDSEKGTEKDTEIKEKEKTKPTVYKSQLEDELEKHHFEGAWIEPKNLWIIIRHLLVPYVKHALTHGTSVDIHALQADKDNEESAKHMASVHARARQYPNDTEHLYSFLQIMTACVASFAHGANDVSNAIGPFSVVYHVWSTGELAGPSTSVPIWALAYGGGMIVIGLATYGYNIMRVMGNHITLISPSRGFTMELAASITVILASQFGIPVSSTMCITGATVGVSLCNGDWRATNWRAIIWIYVGWIMTIPIAATISGCLMGIIVNAPRF